MARLTFSPIVAGASGKAADAVFSNWKGQAYVRKHVIPKNPQTDAQMLQRDAMGRLPNIRRHLRAEVLAAQDFYAVGSGMSGWNWFAGKNVILEKTFESQEISPPNPLCDPLLTLDCTDATGQDITVAWTGGRRGALIYVALWYRRIDEGHEAPFFTEGSWKTDLVSADGTTISPGVAGTYMVVGSVWDSNVTDDRPAQMSGSVFDTVVVA
jgi:hypothetical protein